MTRIFDQDVDVRLGSTPNVGEYGRIFVPHGSGNVLSNPHFGNRFLWFFSRVEFLRSVGGCNERVHVATGGPQGGPTFAATNVGTCESTLGFLEADGVSIRDFDQIVSGYTCASRGNSLKTCHLEKFHRGRSEGACCSFISVLRR